MNATSWKRLIDKIHESNVVPILGSRLLVAPDGQTSLLEQVARELLKDCGQPADVPLPRFHELNKAVSLLRGNCDPQDLYDAVNDAIRHVMHPRPPATPPIPEPIRQLAQIADFRLYVTLTPDDLLAECLRQRCAVNEIVHSPNLPGSEGKDLPPDWQSRAGEVQLLYLFGKSRSAPMFAIHEEDILEYAHNIISHGKQVPTEFLGELQQRNLLLVGCNFPDWLARFFLRSMVQTRLSEKSMRAWVIEPLQPEESLTLFLKGYSRETEVLSQEAPADFVAELHRNWMEMYGPASEQPAAMAEQIPPRGAMFFISYSRKTDAPQAESMHQALLRQGVAEGEIWYDRQTLEPGVDYQRRIIEGIDGCRYFMPLISQAANRREEAFVFREWREACEQNKAMNREYVLPVIVDAEYHPESYTADPVWEWRRGNIDFGHAPGGVPDERLDAKIRKLVREARVQR